MDTENNIYLAFGVLSGSSIYCFLQSGKNKWKIDPPNFRDKVFEFDNKVFDTRLSIGSNRSIYFVDNASNTLYCIQDKEIKK